MSETLNAKDLARLVQRVFQPGADDTGLAIIADLPDSGLPDNADWRARREMAASWAAELDGAASAAGLKRITLAWYPNVGGNNADLPEFCVPGRPGHRLDHVAELEDREAVPFTSLYGDHSLVIALTELSATAPMKVAARSYPIRAATMPGFLSVMLPALKIDYVEVNRRVDLLKELVDVADGAEVNLAANSVDYHLHLDLRHRTGHASGGLFPTNGVAGNLPSGEAYIVPYEGEIEGDPSRSEGRLPVQFDDEVVVYRIAGNKAVEVVSKGEASTREAQRIIDEPAYANLSELGLGVLGDFGLKPTGSILLDEKLGLHIAFGRSDHFGGTVGPDDFSSPEAVVHIDRVYIPEVQPAIQVKSLVLNLPDGPREVMLDGEWVGVF